MANEKMMLTQEDIEYISRAVASAQYKTLNEAMQEAVRLPRKSTLQEKLLTSAITIVGVFVTGLIISALSYGIAFLWRYTLHP